MQTLIRDETLPGSKWAFDENVAACFDDMLARSIPQYDVMRSACLDAAVPYVTPNTTILDLGSSRGQALAGFAEKFGTQNKYVGIEVSAPMIAAAKERFADNPNASFINCDLRSDYIAGMSSVTLSILTLQFTPIEYRQQIVKRVYDHLKPGGAFILVEKIIGASASLDSNFINTYLNFKRRNGYTEEQIQRKRLSLEGVLVPVTARWNEELLRGAGFSEIDCFYRWFNFAGWIAVKPKY